MQKSNYLTIYNASAGSGKTFTLVKEYLKILFTSNNLNYFKNILAITFTNKAVAEMKERIIKTLIQFSEETILIGSNAMFNSICNELKMEPIDLHKKSEKLLNTIIHNYAAFVTVTDPVLSNPSTPSALRSAVFTRLIFTLSPVVSAV